MAGYMARIDTLKAEAWIKCSVAAEITENGIQQFVQKEITNFHQRVMNTCTPSGSTCNTCSTPSVVPCPTYYVCQLYFDKERKCKMCFYHQTVKPAVCPKNICNVIFKEIERNHQKKKPSWKNTDASKWCSNYWELAKCYCPSEGYGESSCANEIDLNGLVSILQFCKFIHMQLGVSGSGLKNVLEKVCEFCFVLSYNLGLLQYSNDVNQFT